MSDLAYYLRQLEALQPEKIELGLVRVQKVADRLNILPFNKKVITVAGTNGKGSSVVLLEQIFISAGYRVASYISPHFINFNERIRNQGKPIDDQLLCDAFEKIFSVKQEVPLTYFELTTLAALWIFHKLPFDIVILEVGLGGRLDAVNIIDADVAILTSIGLDHCAWLGNTRAQIAYEKIWIARQGKPLICGDIEPPQLIAQLAKENNFYLYQINKDFKFVERKDSWNWFSEYKNFYNLPYPKVIIENAATVLMAVQCLAKTFEVSENDLRTALFHAALPGRLQAQIISGKQVIFDVSHNPQAVQQLIKYLQSRFGIKKQYHAIMGMLKDKDIAEIFQLTKSIFKSWYLCELDTNRSYSSSELALSAQENQLPNCHFYSNIQHAFDQALTEIPDGECLIVFGSFYAVAPILQHYCDLSGSKIPSKLK